MPIFDKSTLRLLATLGGCLAGCAAGAFEATAEPEPTLHISKDTYALGEAITFLAGVRSKTPMSPETFEPCEVAIVDPDLRTTTSRVVWPADGYAAYGWSGGEGIAPDEAIPGSYTVRVTCGEKTTEGRFEVEHMPVIEQIEARFDFAEGCRDDPSDITVTLTMVNHSEHRVTVSRPGGLMANGVWFDLERRDPPASCHAFVPLEALGLPADQTGRVLVDSMTHDRLEYVPHVVLAPGQTHAQSFCLGADDRFCRHVWRPSSVAVGTAQQILIGSPNGPFRRFGPLRLPISGEYEP